MKYRINLILMKMSNYSRMLFAVLAALMTAGLVSCVNEEYDVDDLNTEITIAGEGLSLPLGSTKQLTLKSLLSDMDADMLQVLDGGAYALRINDTLGLGDQLPDLKDMMNIPDVDFESVSKYSLSSMDASTMEINEQDFEYGFKIMNDDIHTDVKLPDVSEKHKDPTGVWEYGKAARDMVIEVDDVHVNTKQIFSAPSASDLNIGDVPSRNIDPETVKVSVISECPEGISNISDVMMTETSMFKVTLSAVDNFLASGDVIPDLNLDLGGLMRLEGDKESIVIGDKFILNGANGYVHSELYRIEEVYVKESDWNGDKLNLEKYLTVTGAAALKAAVADAQKLAGAAGGMRLRVDIEFVDLSIGSIMMDVDEVEVTEEMDIAIKMDPIELPEGVTDISKVLFTDNSGVEIFIDLHNISDDIKGLKTELTEFVLTFPEEMTVRDAPDGKVVFSNRNLAGGFDEKIHIDMIEFGEPVKGILDYEGHVNLHALMTVGGRICSADVPYTEEEDGYFLVDAESHFEMKEYYADIDGLTHELEMEPDEIRYELSDDMSDIGTFTLLPEGNPVMTIDVAMPECGLPITGSDKGLVISFPEFMKFKDVPAAYGYDEVANKAVIKGEIPARMEFPIDRLVITPRQDSENGGYYAGGEILIEGSVAVASGEISGSEIDHMISTDAEVKVNMPQFEASEIIFDRFEVNADEEFEFTLMEAGDLPEEVKSVSVVVLSDVYVNFDIAIDNLPYLGAGKVPDADFTLTMPEELLLDPEDERVVDRKVHLVGKIVEGRLDVEPIRLNAIDLTGHDLKSGDDIVGLITLAGNIGADKPELDLSTLDGDMEVKVNASIKDIDISYVKAKLDYDIEGVNESFELSGLPDFMKGEDFVLDLVNPHLILKAKTNIGIPVAGTLNIVPVTGGNEIAENAVTAHIELPYTETAARTDSVTLWLGKDKVACPTDYIFVEADINKLISRIPDELKLSLDAATSSDEECLVEPSADYMLDVEYDFIVPLEFGEDLNIVVRDTISGLPSIMSELLGKNSVQLAGDITSSLPLSLELEVSMLDENGNLVPMEAGATQNIASCNSDGSAAVTPLELTLDVKEGTEVNGLDALILSFKVTAPNFTGIPVAEDDYVQANLKLSVPEGITLDIAELNSDEN